jgi:GTPase SAR1 family protein
MPHDQAYHEAEKKIEAARRSGATNLDLSGMRHTELPKSLGQLTQLQLLNLAGNRLTALPEWLGQLTQLQELNLYGNQLTALPEWLGQLTQLQSLNFSHNPLTALPEWLGQLTQLQSLNLSNNQLTTLPEWLGQLTQLQRLRLSHNQLATLPESLGQLTQLQELNLSSNRLATLSESLGQLTQLQELDLASNQLTALPESLGQLTRLQKLFLQYNRLTDLPSSFIIQLSHFEQLNFHSNPFNPELSEAYKQGLDAVKLYLRLKIGPQVILNEAKLILVGEGEVGKTCLMDALLGNKWQEHPSTHGIEIQQVKVTDPDTQKEITLNGWDFGGQRVYRPTHQLFFSAPAVYLVVWKPREGPQQGFVKEWIQLIKRREPSAKIIVVATHGGPQQRQPDIDRQELRDLFGEETIIDFFFVDSKPDENGERKNIEELKRAIARIAVTLPEVGRSVPKSFQDVRLALQKKHVPYLPLSEALDICRAHKMDDEIARLFIAISHRLGHLTHYENDPALRDIVILRPDWLATAMSYVLDDEQTRNAHGLVKFSRLGHLWDDKTRAAETRYPAMLHPIFLRLMERFDLSYRVADPSSRSDSDSQSLIAQLVPDNRPENLEGAWLATPSTGDIQQTQICRIVDKQTGQSAAAEGLFYQLIVRLHKFSLGRENYNDSVHWQRGLVLDNAYNGRAFLEHKGNDIHITVRAPYPQGLLTLLTTEVKYLVESFWEGLRCDVMVPCIAPCGKDKPGTNLFEVQKLIAFKRKGLKQFPCTNSGCEQLQEIDQLLLNAPAAAQPIPIELLQTEFAAIKGKLNVVDTNTRIILSKIDKTYSDLLQVLTDEAKEGPRLFSLSPVNRAAINPRQWTSEKFKLILWCEHSRLPLPALNGKNSKEGIYEIELTRAWFKKAAPFLKVLTGTLSLVLPLASSGIKLALDDAAYKAIEEQLDFGNDLITSSLDAGEKVGDWLGSKDAASLEHGEAIRADSATLRELHALLKAKDPGFGGLARVLNKRQEFLWVHPQYAKEY